MLSGQDAKNRLLRAIGAIVRAMSGTRKILFAMLLGSLTSAGCTYVAVTPSVNGRAYVVKKKNFFFFRLAGSSLWNCDATSGTPTCYQVKNVDNGPVTVSGGGAASGASASASTPAAGEATNE
jgi:hypothetical protein